MFALAIEYLTGRAVATRFNDRTTPEWPPHPARLFSALAAAAYETSETGATTAEHAWLQWLAEQEPPALAVSRAAPRIGTVSFVPVNDAKLPRTVPARRLVADDLAVLPEYRGRQPRRFPSVTPIDPTVYMIWPSTDLPSEHRDACASLAAKVTYLGHSSSLVAVRPCDDAPPASLVPNDDGDLVLRVPVPGHLTALDRAFASGVRGRLPSGFQRYRDLTEGREPLPRVAEGVFGTFVAFRRRSGPPIPGLAGPRVAQVFRAAALAKCEEPIPEALSGHQRGGTPSEQPHVAYVALLDVGHRHADGHLLGVAAILPRDLSGHERRTVLRALGGIDELELGTAGVWGLERVTAEAPQRGLQADTWVGPATRWASVTPVLLDRFPDAPYGAEAERIVKTACLHVGLPEPSHALLVPQSVLTGVPPARDFRLERRTGKPQRPRVHVVLTFPVPVLGPLLLGAGRYVGWGLCRPLPQAA